MKKNNSFLDDIQRSDINFRYIVIHDINCSNINIKDRESFKRFGFHFAITQTDSGYAYWYLKDLSVGGKTANNAIDICFIEDFMKHEPTKAHYYLLGALISRLMELYDLKKSDIIFCDHQNCPGKYLLLTHIWKEINGKRKRVR